MPRRYTHVKALEKEILEMKVRGMTNREIADHFGFKDKHVVILILVKNHRNISC